MLSTNVENVLHSFVLYTIFGTISTFVLAQLVIKSLKIREPQLKIKLLILPLVMPILGFGIYHLVLEKRCSIGLFYQHGSFLATADKWVHYVSNQAILILTPLFILSLSLAIIKGLISLIACRRMIKNYGFTTPERYPELFRIFHKLVVKADIATPKIIVAPQKYARSFTFGFFNPVILISQGILDFLDEEELEALLAHEIGHIIRKDSLTNFITVLVRDMLFFSPVTYWAFKHLINEKEKAADDITISLTEKPYPFAQALIKVWKLSPKSYLSDLVVDNFLPNPGFIKVKGSLEERVARVIEQEEHGPKEISAIKLNLVITIIVVLSLALLAFVC
jgi:Zn-dependent protease with chaperone function